MADRSAVNLFHKYALFFWNFFIWLLGVTITSLGAWILVQKGKMVRDPIDFFFDPSTLMCTAGSIIVFITFFGWMGALREYTCFLRTYNWILTIIFLGEILLIVFIFVFYFVPDAKQKLGLFPEETFKDAISKYGVEDDEDMQNLIDNIQKNLGCCGFSDDVNGFLDWNNNLYFNCTETGGSDSRVVSPEACSVPASCCIVKPDVNKLRSNYIYMERKGGVQSNRKEGLIFLAGPLIVVFFVWEKGELRNILCGRGAMVYDHNTGKVKGSDMIDNNATSSVIHQEGCLYTLGQWINSNALIIGGVLLAVLLPQMFVMFLARSLRDQILIQKSKWNRLPDRTPQQRREEYTNLGYNK